MASSSEWWAAVKYIFLGKEFADFFGGGGCAEHESLCPTGFFEYFKLYFYNSESSCCPKRFPFPFLKSSNDLDFGDSCSASLPQFSYS